MVALLVNGDWHLRPWEVRKLTISQIFEIYFWPRDDKGKLEIDWPGEENKPNPDPREFFFNLWRNRRLREDHIERKWREYIGHQGA